ncbi:S8 family serine peptidase [Acidobacteriota bacterium]
MFNKTTSGGYNRVATKYRQRIVWITMLLFGTVLLPMLWSQPISSVNTKKLTNFYARGKVAFYVTLDDRIKNIPLSEADRNFFYHERFKKKGLYEHLMGFYYYLHQINTENEETVLADFLRISSLLAEEFVQTIPRPQKHSQYASIQPLLISAGYYAKQTSPQLRKFVRPLGLRVRAQNMFKFLKIRKTHSVAKGKGVKIAIIDTGVDPTIKEIKGRITNYRNLLDGSSPFQKKSSFPFDWNGHGTSVTSLINQISPQAELMIIKFYDSSRMRNAPVTRWTAYLAAAGMIWAAQNGADIINLSAAFNQDMSPLRKAVKYCWNRNILVISSMGNAFELTDENPNYFPARYSWTIAVGGTEQIKGELKIWEHSGTGEYIDIVAPAQDLWVELPSYMDKKLMVQPAIGNSLATAVVSGASALILSAIDKNTKTRLCQIPGQLSERLRSIIRTTGSNEVLGLEFPNLTSGFGLIGIQKAVLLAMSQNDVVTPKNSFN